MRKPKILLSVVIAAATVLLIAAVALAAESAVLPNGIEILEGSNIEVAETESGYELRGLVAASSGMATRANSLLDMFAVPDGIKGEIRRGDIALRPKEIVATGDTIAFSGGEEDIFKAVIVVSGDIIGTGIISIAQLVRMSSVMTGSMTLSGPYLAAGDFTGTGRITLSDVVIESELLVASMQDPV